MLLLKRLKCTALLEASLSKLFKLIHKRPDRVLQLLLELGRVHVLHGLVRLDNLIEVLSEYSR